MRIVVTKLGGAVLSDTEGFLRAVRLINEDPARKYVVVSAPGKRDRADTKVTDLLASLKDPALRTENIERVRERFLTIAKELSLSEEVLEEIETTCTAISDQLQGEVSEGALEFVMSRGEYLSAQILSAALKWPCIDPGDVVRFTTHGRFIDRPADLSLPERAVIPGFYGKDQNGKVWLLPRDGSDITGACIAVIAQADLYEVGKDVAGIFPANPTLVEAPQQPIRVLTYGQAEEMTYRGESVLHDQAISLLQGPRIPVRIFSVTSPEDSPDTYIVPEDDPRIISDQVLIGIGEEKDFTMFELERAGMNASRHFTFKLLGVLSDFSIAYDHIATGKNVLSLVVRNKELAGNTAEVVEAIKKACRAEVKVTENLASICVVGTHLGSHPKVIGGLLQALEALKTETPSDPKIYWHEQSGTGTSIIIGVATSSLPQAIPLLYDYMESLKTS
ncbi:hypothetical protein KJ819_00480 [Patescibacteria group bacterium]|nr:hypothetical protein [Patescibacteria group bacterium]MBU1501112.1 hypothetical protein [Patescibacteria group bacterium]MBU2081015.1 hypothetical protein [Patescibacteria group bacterium]MBU2124106.1 hypothetical protein [Patescibacteria group bacterium]MBU2194962.1 hypothetical protein [Patescibacteria group bacterium]